jgi:hypothetical protein
MHLPARVPDPGQALRDHEDSAIGDELGYEIFNWIRLDKEFLRGMPNRHMEQPNSGVTIQ